MLLEMRRFIRIYKSVHCITMDHHFTPKGNVQLQLFYIIADVKMGYEFLVLKYAKVHFMTV